MKNCVITTILLNLILSLSHLLHEFGLTDCVALFDLMMVCRFLFVEIRGGGCQRIQVLESTLLMVYFDYKRAAFLTLCGQFSMHLMFFGGGLLFPLFLEFFFFVLLSFELLPFFA